jgi:hypothetical protein
MKTTTLNKIRSFSPCKSSWEKLLKSLSKTQADDEEIRFDYLLDILGWGDTIWCLRTLDDLKSAKWIALRSARLVQHLMTDKRSTDCLDVTERFLNGQATLEELETARTAADYAAVYAADYAAVAADYAADYAAVYAAAAAYATRATTDATRAAAYATRAARATAYAEIEKQITQIILEEVSK